MAKYTHSPSDPSQVYGDDPLPRPLPASGRGARTRANAATGRMNSGPPSLVGEGDRGRGRHPLHTITLDALRLDSGAVLAPVTIAYETWGTLDDARENAILICHALTGDSHASDPAHPDDPRAGWWNPLIGSGRVFDTDRYFVICANVIGGCYGSSGPTSPHPVDGRPYGMRFP